MGFPISAFSEKVDAFNSRGILHEAISEKNQRRLRTILQNVFYARIMRRSIPESKAMISGSYKARSWTEVGSVKLFTHIVGNKSLLIGNKLHTFRRALTWRDGI
jgi:hypothetical protein